MLILLIPIFAFILIYLVLSPQTSSQQSIQLLIISLAVVLCAWSIVFVFFFKKIKSIRNHQGLGLKLEEYFSLTIVRYILITFACLVLATGFYFTNDNLYTGIFVANLILAGVIWPTAPKICKDLKLRGDEREMVYYKKDTF
jgi:hypothetical protein